MAFIDERDLLRLPLAVLVFFFFLISPLAFKMTGL